MPVGSTCGLSRLFHHECTNLHFSFHVSARIGTTMWQLRPCWKKFSRFNSVFDAMGSFDSARRPPRYAQDYRARKVMAVNTEQWVVTSRLAFAAGEGQRE